MYLGYGVDYAKYRESLVKLKDMSALYDTILPCHGEIPMDKSQFDKVIACVDAYTTGKLTGVDAVGPEGTACKEYILDRFGYHGITESQQPLRRISVKGLFCAFYWNRNPAFAEREGI